MLYTNTRRMSRLYLATFSYINHTKFYLDPCYAPQYDGYATICAFTPISDTKYQGKLKSVIIFRRHKSFKRYFPLLFFASDPFSQPPRPPAPKNLTHTRFMQKKKNPRTFSSPSFDFPPWPCSAGIYRSANDL